MHSPTHGGGMHATTHPAAMPAATHAAAMPATTAAAASQRRGRQSKRASDEATKDLVVHLISSVVKFTATDIVTR
jgi:hypothetical protein